MWMRDDYEKAASVIAKEFAAGNGVVTINQLATKTAAEAGLNPDGIRTLVRLANVNAFNELFSKQAGKEDRMFEFETGDPEIVISSLHADAKVAHEMNPSVPLAGYNMLADYFGDFSTKTAEDMSNLEEDEEDEEDEDKDKDKEEKPCDEECKSAVLNKSEVTMLYNRAKDKVSEEKKASEIRWGLALEKAACVLREVAGRDVRFNKTAFYRDLVAASNGECLDDVKGLHAFLTREEDTDVLGGMKVAEVIDTISPNLKGQTTEILGYLEEAREARYNWNKCASAERFLNGMEISR
jgi:CRISPR/Cas system CSM-associated protein Csm2 small subunit